ncbi:MAG: hypothetical protein R2821_02805 [Flavobacteriaceae bacterium]
MKKSKVPDEIVAIGKSFFTKTLIPYEKINDFIEYCKPKDYKLRPKIKE